MAVTAGRRPRHGIGAATVWWAMEARRSYRFVAATGLAAAVALMAPPVPAAEVDHLRTVSSSTALDVGRAVGDVVVVDGYLQVDGVVRGHVFGVDSEVILRDRSVVLWSIVINRGALTVEPGAVLPPTIYLNDARFVGPNGEAVDFGETVELGETRVTLDRTVVSSVSVSLMKAVLPFGRFVPPPSLTVRDLRQWHPGSDLEIRRVIEGANEVTVGGIARLKFVSGKVRGVLQRGYRGPSGTVLVTAVHLQDPGAARALWAQVEAAGDRAKLRTSVKSGLGDGAHWFFKRRNRFCMLWQKASWLMAVETRLADRNANLIEQTQFSQEILRSLEQQLSQPSVSSRGVK